MTGGAWNEYRLFLVFAPSASDEQYTEQERLLSGHEAGFEERDLLLVRLLEDGTGAADGEPVSAEAAENARREYSVEDGRFAAALAGKDGGVKFRTEEPVPAREVFGRVDVMPMRRREMRESGGGRG